MDALAQLALMTKAKLLFETADTFLSFPAFTPISYTSDQMNFTNPTSNQQMQAFADFSTWTNALPQGTLFQPALDNMLWDVYQGVLQNAQVAQGSLTAGQTAALQAAQAVLSTQGPGGVMVDTPALIAYKQYQQAYFAASQDYNNQKVTASASADPQVQAAWQNGGEAAARAEVVTAESNWETKGFKAQVESAQSTVETLGSQSPQLKWQSWEALCDPTIDFPTNPSTNSSFGPTLFAPYDIIQQASWPTFSIAGADIPNLVSQAPPELKSIFGATSGDSIIDSLSFEYCSVALSRPWFRPDLFAARFWRFSDPTVQLSNGNNPPSGEWPAYITAAVFARNIVVKTHASGPAPPPPLHTFPPLPLEIVKPVPPAPPHPMPVLLRPQIALNERVLTTTSAAPVSSVAHAASAVPAGRMTMIAPKLGEQEVAGHGVAVLSPAQPLKPVIMAPALRMRLSAATFSSQGAQAPAPTTPPPPPPSGQGQSSDVSVLAFICKRLPKCPNPDATLSWI